jgi:hypothetical protein
MQDAPALPPSTQHVERSTLFLAVLFLVPRVALLFARQPFYDEFFTHWISAKSFVEIVHALHLDSGPPLYYFVIHALGNPPIAIARGVSLLCSSVTCVLLYRRSKLAATMFAVYPPAVLMSVDARSYAMCAMFIAIGILYPRSRAVAFAAAAYCHYYGVLFFPLLLPKQWRGFILASALFAPGLWLAVHQPADAMAWNSFNPFFVVVNPSFAGSYVDALLASPPKIVIIVALFLLIVALTPGSAGVSPAVLRSRVGDRPSFPGFVLLPMALTLIAAAAGRAIYFPLRFESVIAAPLMLWTAASLPRRRFWAPVASTLVAIGAFVIAIGTIDHAQRGPGDCTRAARMLRERLQRDIPVVASGYCYLESSMVLPVIAFPPDEAQHPGWWRPLPPEVLGAATRSLPQRSFVWIGSQYAPELNAIRRARRTEMVGHAGNVVFLQVY